MSRQQRNTLVRRLVDDRDGATAVVFAVVLPAMVGFAGLGVETGYWYFKHRQLQTAADLASYAGATVLRSGGSEDDVEEAALREATLHGFVPAKGTIIVNTPPTSGTHQTNRSVEVLLTNEADRYFSQVLDDSPVVMGVRAVSNWDQDGSACILALDTWANDAVIFIGNPTASFSDCNVMSNSLADDSITIAGSAEVTVPCIISAGGTSITADLTLTDCVAPMEDMPQAADPYKNLPEPPLPTACSTLPGGNPHDLKTISAGRYCGGLNLSGQYQLNPGVYVIDGGEFRINAGADVAGTGVTFFLTNGATVHFNGTAEINLTAPTTGTYAGVLFYGDRQQGDADNIFNGTADSVMTGALYFPSQMVRFNGNFSGQNGCLRMIARAIDLGGNADFQADCAGTGINDIPIPGPVRMVE
jgi:hypothetical protein